MKKSITAIEKVVKKPFKTFKGRNDRSKSVRADKIAVSNPIKSTSVSTSALLPESFEQFEESLNQCHNSTLFLKRLFEMKKYELVTEAVTIILKQTMTLLDGVSRSERNSSDPFNEDSFYSDSETLNVLECDQQRARKYLATLVKLSDNLAYSASDDVIILANEMVDKLLETLKKIKDQAQTIVPQTSNSLSRKSLSLEKLDIDETDGDIGMERSSIRRSFRRNYDSLRRKMTKNRHQSTDRLVRRRSTDNIRPKLKNAIPGIIGNGLGNENGRLSAPNAQTSLQKRCSNISSNSSNRIPSLSSKSTDSILDIQNDWADSRPCSGASYDLLSNCSSNMIDHEPHLQLKDDDIPPKLPPKEFRPKLGGLDSFRTPVKQPQPAGWQQSTESEIPPELPIKISPVKSYRDSGLDMIGDVRKSAEFSRESFTDNVKPLELLDLILFGSNSDKDLLEIFLSSYRTFMDIDTLIDALLKRIRKQDSCLKNHALQILIRVVGTF